LFLSKKFSFENFEKFVNGLKLKIFLKDSFVSFVKQLLFKSYSNLSINNFEIFIKFLFLISNNFISLSNKLS
jgi:hypothetical protein